MQWQHVLYKRGSKTESLLSSCTSAATSKRSNATATRRRMLTHPSHAGAQWPIQVATAEPFLTWRATYEQPFCRCASDYTATYIATYELCGPTQCGRVPTRTMLFESYLRLCLRQVVQKRAQYISILLFDIGYKANTLWSSMACRGRGR